MRPTTRVRLGSRSSVRESSSFPVPVVHLAVAAVLLLSLSACATLREVGALTRVDFSLARVSEGTLAGIPIQSVRSPGELSAISMARFASALSRNEMPLTAVIEVRADNPSDNARARMVGFDWTLFLDDRETVSGFLDEEYLLPPGEPVIVPLAIEVDLLDFFDGQIDRILDLALAVAGAGEPRRIRLEATPTIQTPVGPMRYPEPVRVEYEAGG